MILHPAVLANLVATASVAGMVAVAGTSGWRILRHWDLASGSEMQLALERRTYLVSTFLAYALGLQLISLFLFVFTAETLHNLFVGAMCAAGVLNVNAYGYPTLILKVVNFLLAGIWLILNYADNQAYDYPLIRRKYILLCFLAPMVLVEAGFEGSYFLNLRADVITSCCGAIFSAEAKDNARSWIAALPPLVVLMWFYATLLTTMCAGMMFYFKRRFGYLYAGLSLTNFVVALLAIICVIALYIYESPTHHCPFCLLQPEYGYVGYLIYLALFLSAVTGAGIAVVLPFREISSLHTIIPSLAQRLAAVALVSQAIFGAVVTYRIVFSNLVI